MKQLDLSLAWMERHAPADREAGWTPDSLSRALSTRLKRTVRVAFTNNRSTMVSYREEDDGLAVRVHRMFTHAGAAEVEALAIYVQGNHRQAGTTLDAFIAGALPGYPSEAPQLVPRGRFHDLTQIFSELNVRFFHGACRASITWGQAGTRRYRRSIQLGSFVATHRLIRIHPSLDQAFVPRPYVAWIVFHEMLHEVFGVEHGGGHRCLHPREFVAIEETFPDFAACKAWEEQNLHRLLAFRRAKR